MFVFLCHIRQKGVPVQGGVSTKHRRHLETLQNRAYFDVKAAVVGGTPGPESPAVTSALTFPRDNNDAPWLLSPVSDPVQRESAISATPTPRQSTNPRQGATKFDTKSKILSGLRLYI